MAAEVEVLLGAEIDLLKIYSQRGEIFYEVFDECLIRLAAFPESGPLYLAPFRRLLIPKTPAGIFYTVEGRRVFVHAVLDLRSNPQRMAERLRS